MAGINLMILNHDFFNYDAQLVAQTLLGKVIHVKYGQLWLRAMIIETEAYYKHERASHASLGFTAKRKALFMPPGTIYMYYARGGDSLNFSCLGEGNAVLIKSGVPYLDKTTEQTMLATMQALNPAAHNNPPRSLERLCRGQTLLCKSLALKVTDWDQKKLDPDRFYLSDVGYTPSPIVQTTRLGIPKGRDAHLPYRFVDYDKAHLATENPLKKRRPCYSLINLKEK